MKLVIGAGLIGTRVARRLAARGEDVVVATRSGTAVPVEGGAGAIRSVRADAADAEALIRAAAGATTIVLASNPAQYHRWPQLWPPVFDATLAAATRSGADLVVMGNLYAYGEGARMPMAEHDPLLTTEQKGLVRKAGWERILEAHRRGDLRAVEVRASDYFGPGSGATAQLGERFFGPLLAGRRPRVVGDPRMPHSWAYLDDIADTVVAASTYAGEWGRAWHVPSAEPLSRVEIAARVAALTGRDVGVTSWSPTTLRALGFVSPFLRAVVDSSYQFTAPFVVDARETERELGVSATPWDVALPATLASLTPSLRAPVTR
ncbi:NAD-dependent epimerase/dehydratase family protein [Cnuibacter physcomitrellae]|uniref:NAD-dependent epimerase/dehydratase family protein n=1 Tax=Cnuibacter physcomitrellae TaxID=1619308 RepID=UPI0021761C0F|nr:NAD-dependent epimerase/dehydratase family protein [Cnuibacter physcomitrellae]MCS5496091.1 NAD-dependent epimerase/dehydratase family protein [Cnuibacter physcomitrellae]